jgi:hypothetical protein
MAKTKKIIIKLKSDKELEKMSVDDLDFEFDYINDVLHEYLERIHYYVEQSGQ